MSKPLSNELADLAERVKEANRLSDLAQRQSAERSIEAGQLLVSAKAECRHGEWLPFLERAGIPERHAQRLMQLARSGLKPDMVTEIGGIAATLKWLSDFRIPGEGEALLVDLNPEHEVSGDAPYAFVWLEDAGYRVVMFDLHPASPHVIQTKKPICRGSAEFVRYFVARVLDFRFAEMSFYNLDQGALQIASLICEIETLNNGSVDA